MLAKSILEIFERYGFYKFSNTDLSKYYSFTDTRTSKKFRFRTSNHGTHLRTWLERGWNPSKTINYNFVFAENEEDKINYTGIRNKDRKHQINSFIVKTYIYDANNLEENDIKNIIKAINEIGNQRPFKYIDPLAKTDKVAIEVDVSYPNEQNNTQKYISIDESFEDFILPLTEFILENNN